MGRKTILTCAVTGNLTTREQHPGLPVTPEEIARAAIEAGEAGAAVAHIHARDPKTQKGSMDTELFREIVDRIRESGRSGEHTAELHSLMRISYAVFCLQEKKDIRT